MSKDVRGEVKEPMLDRLQYMDIIGAVNLRAGQGDHAGEEVGLHAGGRGRDPGLQDGGCIEGSLGWVGAVGQTGRSVKC